MISEKTKSKTLKVTLNEIFTNKSVIVSLTITFLLLMFFHLASTITVPGIHVPDTYDQAADSFSGMLNLLAGGGLARMSIFAVGVGPYITSQIIVQLLSSDLVPPLSRMAKMGERGRKKLEVITRCLTLPFCFAQGYAVIAMLLNTKTSGDDTFKIFGHTSLAEISAGEIFALMLIFAGGTYVAIFIGDMITKRGVGNGVTLLILSGIVSSIIGNFQVSFESIMSKFDNGSMNFGLNVALSSILYLLFFIVILLAVIFVNNSTRKIPVQQTGQGLTSNINDLPFLPIKLNAAGVIPVIFASSVMTIPGTIAQFLKEGTGRQIIQEYFTTSTWSGLAMYFFMVVLFSFFYSYIQLNPQQISENFSKSGKFIPGIKVGEDTEKHITKVLFRINWIGAPFLAVIASLPYFISIITKIPSGLALGGTGIIIMVTGSIELWNSIKSASTTSGYNLTKAKIEANYFEEKVVNEKEVSQLW